MGQKVFGDSKNDFFQKSEKRFFTVPEWGPDPKFQPPNLKTVAHSELTDRHMVKRGETC